MNFFNPMMNSYNLMQSQKYNRPAKLVVDKNDIDTLKMINHRAKVSFVLMFYFIFAFIPGYILLIVGIVTGLSITPLDSFQPFSYPWQIAIISLGGALLFTGIIVHIIRWIYEWKIIKNLDIFIPYVDFTQTMNPVIRRYLTVGSKFTLYYLTSNLIWGFIITLFVKRKTKELINLYNHPLTEEEIIERYHQYAQKEIRNDYKDPRYDEIYQNELEKQKQQTLESPKEISSEEK